MTDRERLNRITESMTGAAIEVHRALGPGLLESAYEACLTKVLNDGIRRVVNNFPDSPRSLRTLRLTMTPGK